MRMSVFVALLFAYVVGCLAVAFVAVSAIEHIVGDLGPDVSTIVFAVVLLGLLFQVTWVLGALMRHADAKQHARSVQLVTEARASAAELPQWSNRAELEAALRAAGLAEWAPRLADLARRCVLLVPGSIAEDAPIGACRLGGQPDMPADVEWPLRPPLQPQRKVSWAGPYPGHVFLGRFHWLHRLFQTRKWKQSAQGWERTRQAETDVRNQEWPLSFVAQVDFADLHAVCALDGFPTAGRLLFFCDPFDWPWGEAEDQAGARVIFTQAPVERLERKPVPPQFNEPVARELMPRGWAFKPRILRPTAWLLPPHAAFITQHNWPGWSEAQDDAYQQFWERLYTQYPDMFSHSDAVHQVGGTAWSIQETVEAACATFAGTPPERADGWQLVLQVDSDIEVGMEWGDSGRLYACARKEDVAAGRFDRCWTVMQCY
jgi:uncharacterized protein YwqG